MNKENMTIDEVIANEKEKAENGKKEYLMLQDDNFTDIETYEKRLNNCARFIEEHEQIAEWLEELKELKNADIPIIHGKAELEYHDAKIIVDAIDKCIRVVENSSNLFITSKQKDEMAWRLEQLKEKNEK